MARRRRALLLAAVMVVPGCGWPGALINRYGREPPLEPRLFEAPSDDEPGSFRDRGGVI